MFIYKTTNLVNGKIYVGQHTKDDDNYLGSGTIFKIAVLKYGRENFDRKIIEHCETKENLNLRENYWITKLDSTNPAIGYNLLPGGDAFEVDKHQRKMLQLFRKWEKGTYEGLDCEEPYNRVLMVNGSKCFKAYFYEIPSLLENGFVFSKRTTRITIYNLFKCKIKERDQLLWAQQVATAREAHKKRWDNINAREKKRLKILREDKFWVYHDELGHDLIFPWQLEYYEEKNWRRTEQPDFIGNMSRKTQEHQRVLNYCYYKQWLLDKDYIYEISIENREELWEEV